jgi:hypothetical protein
MRVKIKKVIKLIDDRFLFSFLNRLRFFVLKRQLRASLDSLGGRSFTTYISSENVFAGLCDRYGTDKGTNGLDKYPFEWAPHRYSDFYDVLFRQRRNEIKRVFECGIGTGNLNFSANMGQGARPGASLRVWREYFPNALVYGADIDSEVLFTEDRIFTFVIDQLNQDSIQNAIKIFEPGTFQLIVDDGLHTFEANATLFRNSNHLLSDQGIYIIEDVTPANLKKLLSLSKEFTSFEFLPVVFREVHQSHELNSLLMITKKPTGNL